MTHLPQTTDSRSIEHVLNSQISNKLSFFMLPSNLISSLVRDKVKNKIKFCEGVSTSDLHLLYLRSFFFANKFMWFFNDIQWCFNKMFWLLNVINYSPNFSECRFFFFVHFSRFFSLCATLRSMFKWKLIYMRMHKTIYSKNNILIRISLSILRILFICYYQ